MKMQTNSTLAATFVTTFLFLLSTVHGALQNPSVPFSPTDPVLTKITIAGGDLQGQSIPVGYASTWPVWMASADGGTVTRIPDHTFQEEEDGWVNPLTFEQMWLPMDLPPPTARVSLGVVLKDGVPRYLFPTVETILATSDGGAWHNRGLYSLPIGKTWLPFADGPMESLRLSSYRRPMPPTDGKEEDKSDWIPIVPLTKVTDVLNKLMNVIANGPDEMGQGFCYLIAPLSVQLPADAVVPGQRIRLFLSNLFTIPTSQDLDDDSAWLLPPGECDLTVHNVAPGGNSKYLPAVYKPLYDKKECS
eukprot:scaffold218424_cov52-Attheya_sp.AAC.3